MNAYANIICFLRYYLMMYFLDNKEHNIPHFHVRYAEYEASVAIETGEIIVEDFPRNKLKLITAWAEIHRDELKMNWKMPCEGQPVNKIEPLK